MGLPLFGGFHKWGYPKIDGLYMFIWENPTEMDDDWRYPHDYGNHHFFFEEHEKHHRLSGY